MSVAFDPADPASWPALPQPFLVHDYGGAQDYSTIIVGGVAPWSRGVVGATRIERLPLRMTSTETLERLAEADRELAHRATVVVDASGNSAHAEACAAAFGRRCIGVRITAAPDHGLRPQPVPFTVAGKRAVLPVWQFGRTPLFDQLGAAMERGEVKVAKAGDWRELAQEMEGLERVTTDAGNIRFVTTAAKHDDLAVSLALLVWAATRLPLSAITAPRATMPRHRPPPPGWFCQGSRQRTCLAGRGAAGRHRDQRGWGPGWSACAATRRR